MSSSWSVRLSTAVFGAALVVGIAPALQGRAHPGQLPSAMTGQGLAVEGPALQLAALIVGVIAFAAIGDLAAQRLDGVRRAMFREQRER